MKTQKILLPALLMFGSFLASCSKEAVDSRQAAKSTLANTNGEMGTLAIDTFAVKASLAAAPWIYYELFGAYHDPNGASKLLYKHERIDSNALNVRNDITTYNATNNTFIEKVPVSGGTLTIEGYFRLNFNTDGGVMLTTVITAPVEYRGTSISELTRLPDNINMVWYSNASDRLGIMYHPNTVPVSSSGSVASRLIGKKWQYENYFRDYSRVDCDLLYRANRKGTVPVIIDLSPIQVLYIDNENFTETTLGGVGGQDVVRKGKWWLTDNETLLHTKLEGGTESIGQIRLLNANRLQWATLSGGGSTSRAGSTPITYADMVIQGTTIP